MGWIYKDDMSALASSLQTAGRLDEAAMVLGASMQIEQLEDQVQRMKIASPRTPEEIETSRKANTARREFMQMVTDRWRRWSDETYQMLMEQCPHTWEPQGKWGHCVCRACGAVKPKSRSAESHAGQ